MVALYLRAAVGTEIYFWAVGRSAVAVVLAFCAVLLIERIGLFTAVHDIIGGIAIFALGIFVIVNGRDYHHNGEAYSEDRKEDRSSHGNGGYSPCYTENNAEYTGEKTHHGGTASRFYAFHENIPPKNCFHTKNEWCIRCFLQRLTQGDETYFLHYIIFPPKNQLTEKRKRTRQACVRLLQPI